MGPSLTVLDLGAEPMAEILRHAAEAEPAECCGVLVGHGAGRRVVEVHRAANVAAAPARGFVLDPAAWLAAERRARRLGLEVLGCYHSHPAAPAHPSATDALAVAPSWSYVVVGVGPGGSREVRSFRAVPDTGLVEEGVV